MGRRRPMAFALSAWYTMLLFALEVPVNKKQLIVIGCALLFLGIQFGLAQQRPKATVAINADIAWFRIDGSKLQGTADKRLTFVTMHYNEVSVPCVVVDSKTPGLNYNEAGSASISCGWSPEAIQALSAAGKP